MKRILTRILAAFVIFCLLAGLVGIVDAGNRIGSRRALLTVAEEIRYLLRATFSVGNIALNAGDMNTQAPGSVEDGTLTVVETDGAIAIVGNKLAFTAQGTPVSGDLAVVSQALSRQFGYGLLGTIELSAVEAMRPIFWLSSATPTPANWVYYWQITDVPLFRTGTSGAGITNWSAPASDTEYSFCIVLGGYDSNGAAWRSGQPKANYLYGATWFLKGGSYTNWTLFWGESADNTATLYAGSDNRTAVGTIDNLLVPDGDLSAVLQPNNLSTMGSSGELSAYAPDVGGGWTEDIGDWDTDGTSLVATMLGIGSFTGLADSVYDAKITTPAAGTTAGGLVMRATDFTGASEDYWYAKVTPGTAGTDWEIIEYVNGAATQRAAADVDWTAATAYAVRCILDTQEISCFADGGDKISYASATSGQTATTFGLRDEGNSNMTFDNVVAFARTSGVYEATLGGY